jgi:hypothetical protein
MKESGQKKTTREKGKVMEEKRTSYFFGWHNVCAHKGYIAVRRISSNRNEKNEMKI